ncbi:MAG: RNA polymerase sigma factor [Deltaproteobacteria bacterium]|nr:RNA polymerase sigma factor [Deltaproteobacteria bacterium]
MNAGSFKQIDQELVKRSVAGDKKAGEELAAACLPRVYRTVYLLVSNDPEAEDLVQSAMIQAFRDLSQFRGSGSFTSWLDRVTVNVVRQHFRRRWVKSLIPSSDEMDKMPSTGNDSPDKQTEGRRFMQRLSRHLAGIRPKNRMAIVLSLVQGYTSSEIALTVGCNLETAKKRLTRGRQDLVARVQRDPYCRQLLKEMGI